MAEIVRFSAGLLVARQVERLGRDAQLLHASVAAVARRGRRGARPELEHPVLVIRAYGPLGFHGAEITPKQQFWIAYVANTLQKIFSTRTCIARLHYLSLGVAKDRDARRQPGVRIARVALQQPMLRLLL